MSLFIKSVLIGLITSIVLTGISRLISVYYKKKEKYKESYVKIYSALGRVQMIRINLIKNYEYLH